MDSLIQVLAQALDLVEIALIGATTNHGKRIAVLCSAMGRRLGLPIEELSDLVSCALLHDNALTEYILLQQGREEDNPNLGTHCAIGQSNAEILPFNKSIEGFILYHHERADGQGPFGLSEGHFPLQAELIAISDMIDAERHLESIATGSLVDLRKNIEAEIHNRFTERAGNALLDVFDENMLSSLRNDKITETTNNMIPVWTRDMNDPALVPFAEFISHIIDRKSITTGTHTEQIANRIWLMSEFYGYDMTEKIKLFLAAALHDIGKLAIPSEILEKPGKLNKDEFGVIKNHVSKTHSLLSEMEGLGLITEWASNHHEKLDGSGYPRGLKADQLDFNSRLMTCIDIYQAVSEKRPYHSGRDHGETMLILREMADAGKIDSGIVNDIDKVMAELSGRNLPRPKLN
ncbi:MAG: HD domain-containing protein [Treponema sp.]|nr:HD domain-containing protein [Treponema sp.]